MFCDISNTDVIFLFKLNKTNLQALHINLSLFLLREALQAILNEAVADENIPGVILGLKTPDKGVSILRNHSLHAVLPLFQFLPDPFKKHQVIAVRVFGGKVRYDSWQFIVGLSPSILICDVGCHEKFK